VIKLRPPVSPRPREGQKQVHSQDHGLAVDHADWAQQVLLHEDADRVILRFLARVERPATSAQAQTPRLARQYHRRERLGQEDHVREKLEFGVSMCACARRK
jgi:hypothetical protein